MFRQFDPQRPVLPLLQIERTTIDDAPFLFGLQPVRHVVVVYHEQNLGIGDKRPDVHVARTD
jgi:hypothetical protein